MLTAFEIVAKITADSSGFSDALGKVQRSGTELKNSLSNTFGKIKKIAAGAISVAAIKKGIDAVSDFANEVSAAGDRVDKQSQVLGLSRKAYQEWDYILGQNGASIDSLSAGMRTLNKMVLDAKDGAGEAKDSFARLGLNIHEIENLNPEDQFEAVVRAFQKMPAGVQKSALAVKLLGRGGMQLLPLLNQSETSIDELRQRAEELGLVMSDEAVDASVVYGDSLDDLQRTFNAFKYAIGSKILPPLTTGIQKITNYAGKLRKAYDSNGFAGIWDTLVTDFKNIKWPTWSDVKSAAIRAWNTIKEGASNLAGLVFGKAEDGSIAWPDINKLIKDFDTWWAKTALPALQKGMVWYLTLFGVPQESAEQIKNSISTWWDGTVQFVKDACGWALNPPKEPYEAGNQLGQIIGKWWESKRIGLQKLLRWTLGLPEISDSQGIGMRRTIREWFLTKVIPGLANVVSWFLPPPGVSDEDGSETRSKIQIWWEANVYPHLSNILQFTLGLFNMGDPLLMAARIRIWWENVKTATSLFIDLLPTFIGLPKFSDMGAVIEQWWNNVLLNLAELSVKIVSIPDEWIKTVKGWLDGAKQATINFVSGTVDSWIKTVNGWLDGSGLKDIGLNFSATVSEWIDRIWNWAQNGIDIVTNFLSGNSGNSESGDWQSRQPSGAGFAETWQVGGFAKGLNYVPYDNYPALLHRGEQVLTASQARKRDGDNSGIDLSTFAQSIIDSVREGMEGASVNSYLDGRSVTGGVSRRTVNQLKSRRFVMT